MLKTIQTSSRVIFLIGDEAVVKSKNDLGNRVAVNGFQVFHVLEGHIFWGLKISMSHTQYTAPQCYAFP